MALVMTTRGLLEESALSRTVGVEDRPEANDFVVWVEWKLDGEIVRRDVWVNLKRTIEGQAMPGPSDVTIGLTGVAASAASGGL